MFCYSFSWMNRMEVRFERSGVCSGSSQESTPTQIDDNCEMSTILKAVVLYSVKKSIHWPCVCDSKIIHVHTQVYTHTYTYMCIHTHMYNCNCIFFKYIWNEEKRNCSFLYLLSVSCERHCVKDLRSPFFNLSNDTAAT